MASKYFAFTSSWLIAWAASLIIKDWYSLAFFDKSSILVFCWKLLLDWVNATIFVLSLISLIKLSEKIIFAFVILEISIQGIIWEEWLYLEINISSPLLIKGANNWAI